MLKVAITGNIASGKTTFEKYIKETGYDVLCLDTLTHQFYESNEDVKNQIIELFGTLDRAEISKIVFSNPAKKKQLENIIHPSLLDEMKSFFDKNKDSDCAFISAALIFEAGFDKFFDKIILVCASDEIRLQRLMQRNSFSKEEALRRINSQIPDNEKFLKVNYIVENNNEEGLLLYKAKDVINMLLKKQ